MIEAPLRCSAVAEELGEPMAGSVEQRGRWLLVEDRGAWGRDAVDDVVGRVLATEAKRRGVRIVLVKRREGDPVDDAVRRLVLADTERHEMAIRDATTLGDLDADWLATTPLDVFGDALEGPIFLVCTNGRRDACCALRGRALMTALAEEHAERTWECTHLGGHRFAANLVALPDGIVYGRVLPADGPRVVGDHLAGRLDVGLLRGRSSWPPAAQVAERELRLARDLDGIDAVRLESAESDDERATVTLRAEDGARHRVELLLEAAEPPRATSCRANDLEAPRHWRVVASEALPV